MSHQKFYFFFKIDLILLLGINFQHQWGLKYSPSKYVLLLFRTEVNNYVWLHNCLIYSVVLVLFGWFFYRVLRKLFLELDSCISNHITLSRLSDRLIFFFYYINQSFLINKNIYCFSICIECKQVFSYLDAFIHWDDVDWYIFLVCKEVSKQRRSTSQQVLVLLLKYYCW